MQITKIERNYNKFEDAHEIVMWVNDTVEHCSTPIVVKNTKGNSLYFKYASKLFKNYNK